MQVLKGAEVSAKIKEEVQGLLASVEGPAPKLAIVRVGERPDDMSYERGAIKKMENFGLRVQSYVFPGDIGDAEFKEQFAAVNGDPDVAGILLLRPLPRQICESDIEKMIDPAGRPDGISPANNIAGGPLGTKAVSGPAPPKRDGGAAALTFPLQESG